MVKNLPEMQDTRFDPWVRKIPGEGNGNSLQYSCLANTRTEETGGLQSMGSQSWTRLPSVRAGPDLLRFKGREKAAWVIFGKYGLSHGAFAKLFLVEVGEVLLAGVVPSDGANKQTCETPCVLSVPTE